MKHNEIQAEEKIDLKEQLQNLVDFIDTFKNTTDFTHLADLVKFVVLPLIANNPEAVAQMQVALEEGKALEEAEAKQALKENPDALLSDLEHSGVEFLKNTLGDMRGIDPKELQIELKTLYKKTKSLEMMNTKVAGVVFSKEDLTEETGVSVGKRGKKPVIVNVSSYVYINGEKLPSNCTPYDREVLNGICSIWASGQRYMTPKMIYEAFAGKANNSPQAIGHVTRSIEKLCSTIISIDWTEHAKMSGLPLEDGDYITFNSNLLFMKGVKTRFCGQKMEAYELIEAPILYEYARKVGQIATVDKNLLNIESVSNTEESILIKNYLLRRIELMKNPRNKITSNVILFKSLFSECGIEQNAGNTRKKAQQKREIIYKILNAWKRQGYIKGYEPQKEKQKITGVVIQYTPNTLEVSGKGNR